MQDPNYMFSGMGSQQIPQNPMQPMQQMPINPQNIPQNMGRMMMPQGMPQMAPQHQQMNAGAFSQINQMQQMPQQITPQMQQQMNPQMQQINQNKQAMPQAYSMYQMNQMQRMMSGTISGPMKGPMSQFMQVPPPQQPQRKGRQPKNAMQKRPQQIPSRGSTPAYSPASARGTPAFSPTIPQQMAIHPDPSFIKTQLAAINSLQPDRQDLLYRLFDLTNQKESRFDQLSNTISQLCLQNQFAQNIIQTILLLVERLKINEYFQRFKEPTIPCVLSRIKNVKPIYRFLIFRNSIEINPNLNGLHKGNKHQGIGQDKILLGSFLNLSDQVPLAGTSVKVSGVEIPPVAFGETDPYYILHQSSSGAKSQPLSVTINAPPNIQLSWFVVQVVEKRPPEQVARQLAPKQTLVTINQFTNVHTSKCHNCAFPVLNIIEEIQRNGGALCPQCNIPILLAEILFDAKMVMPEDTQRIIAQKIPEEPPSTQEARTQMADDLFSLMRFSFENPAQAENECFFDFLSSTPDEMMSNDGGHDILWSSTTEYLDSLRMQ